MKNKPQHRTTRLPKACCNHYWVPPMPFLGMLLGVLFWSCERDFNLSDQPEKTAQAAFFQQHLGFQGVKTLPLTAFSDLNSFQQRAASSMPDLAVEATWQQFTRLECRDFCLTLTPLNGENSFLGWLQTAPNSPGKVIYLEWIVDSPPGAFFQLYTPSGLSLSYSTLSGLEGSGYDAAGSSATAEQCQCCSLHGGKPSMRAIFLEDWTTIGAGDVAVLMDAKKGVPNALLLAVHAYWCAR